MAARPALRFFHVPAAVLAHIDAAVIAIVDAAGRRGGHEQSVMIGVRVTGRAAVRVPMRDLLPLAAAIRRPVQIHAAADDMVRVVGMDDDRIAVGHLPFGREMSAGDVLPGITAIARAEDPKHTFSMRGRLQIQHVGI